MFKKSLLALSIAALTTASLAAPLIDNFDTAQPTAIDSTNGVASSTTTTSAVDLVNIIGGEREVYVNAVSGADSLLNTAAGVSSSRFSFINGSGVAGFGAIRWDGTSATGFDLTKQDFGIDRTGFAPVNFSASADSIKLTVVRSDAGFPFTLQFFSSDTAWTTFTFSAFPVCAAGDVSCLAQPGAQVGPQDFFFNFAIISAFGTNFGGGADFSNITALQAIFNFNLGTGTPGQAEAVDFTIDLVEGGRVPEPGSLALAGLALVGLSAAARRRSRKSI